MSVLVRLRNPGLCSPVAHAHTHTHTHTHTPPYACLHAPTSLPGSSRMMSCRGDPHEPVGRLSTCGEPHHFRADPSPRRRLRLISCPSSPVGPEGTLAADGASLSHILCGQIRLHQQRLWLRDPQLPDALQAGLSPSKSAQDRLGDEFLCNSIY